MGTSCVPKIELIQKDLNIHVARARHIARGVNDGFDQGCSGKILERRIERSASTSADSHRRIRRTRGGSGLLPMVRELRGGQKRRGIGAGRYGGSFQPG